MNDAYVNKVHAAVLKAVGQPFVGQTKEGVYAMGAEVLYGSILEQLITAVIEQAKELGRQFRPQIEEGAQLAIANIVAWDIPGIPEWIEVQVDAQFESLATSLVKQTLDVLFAATPIMVGDVEPEAPAEPTLPVEEEEDAE